MANRYYIISEVLFFNNKEDKKTWDFLSETEINLTIPCESKTPTLPEIKKILVDLGLETKEIYNQSDRIEVSATQRDKKGIWLIFTDIKEEKQETNMFEIGRGSNPDLTIAFIKLLGRTHGKFLYYCDNGRMTLITKDKDTEQIKNEIYS